MRESDAFQNRPVSMNPKNNLLEIEEHMYILDDVEKPNVFRNMFPYSEIPKIPFRYYLQRRTAVQSTLYHRADRKNL